MLTENGIVHKCRKCLRPTRPGCGIDGDHADCTLPLVFEIEDLEAKVLALEAQVQAMDRRRKDDPVGLARDAIAHAQAHLRRRSTDKPMEETG